MKLAGENDFDEGWISKVRGSAKTTVVRQPQTTEELFADGRERKIIQRHDRS